MRYPLYGLSVESDHPLPGLRATGAGGPADVRLWVGSHPVDPAAVAAPWHVSNRATPGGDPTLTAFRGDGWCRLLYADGTEFTIDRGGTRVGCTWMAPMTVEDAATYLLGPVFGVVLRLRGVTCVHASTVAVDGRALLVCGPAGAGKSTTAAAFAARGHKVLGDDVAALEPVAGAGIRVRSAYPHLRLWPDAVRALYGPGAELPALTPNWEKRYLDLEGGEAAFHARPLPVGAVYLLAAREEDGAPRLEPLAPAEAVLQLVGNTYMGWLPELAAQARDLAVYAGLARAVPVLRVVPHAHAARLGELCGIIERHFTEGTAEGGDD